MVLAGNTLSLGSNKEWRLEFFDQRTNGGRWRQTGQDQRNLAGLEVSCDLVNSGAMMLLHRSGPRVRMAGIFLDGQIAWQRDVYWSWTRRGRQIHAALHNFHCVPITHVE